LFVGLDESGWMNPGHPPLEPLVEVAPTWGRPSKGLRQKTPNLAHVQEPYAPDCFFISL